MGQLKTARLSNELIKNDLILAKYIKKKMNLAKIKSFLNGLLDRPAVLSGPMAFDLIYSHKYFHIFIYFIHQVIADFSKHAARAIATLVCSQAGTTSVCAYARTTNASATDTSSTSIGTMNSYVGF